MSFVCFVCWVNKPRTVKPLGVSPDGFSAEGKTVLRSCKAMAPQGLPPHKGKHWDHCVPLFQDGTTDVQLVFSTGPTEALATPCMSEKTESANRGNMLNALRT